MPRTKRPQKSTQEEINQERDLRIHEFKRQADLRIMKLESEGKMKIKSLGNFIDITRSRLPKEVLQMTLNDVLYCETDEQKENHNKMSSVTRAPAPTSTKARHTSNLSVAASDDGYGTESGMTTHTSRTAKTTNVEPHARIRTRSSSRNSRSQLSEISGAIVKAKKKNPRKESTKMEKFKTPAPVKPYYNQYSMITPKVKPNTPLNVLRRPRQGEMVLSMQGSPLLVSAVVEEETANINVPLKNGNVISLLPKDGLRMSNIPALDPETMRQLATLKSHIEKVISFK